MSYSESEAVAKDFQEALEDIQSNARYEIQNLTLIARENTEHALAISGALMEHIKRAAPHKKLPSMYVLDSIVKNVGTPYTLFFGRKLYQTFMDAYASVDMTTRRKMDEMLKTWKEPVPGSIDTRPVFPPDVVRPIENALLKARSNALQAQQSMGQPHMMGRGRPMPPNVPYRESATPPGVRPYYDQHGPPQGHNGPPYGHPAQPPAGPFYPPQQQHNQHPPRSTPQPSPLTAAFQPPAHMGSGYPAPQAGISIDSLNDDIQRLIAAFRAQIAQNPHDTSMQTRLKALMDLQTILQLQNLPQEQLVLVKNQITELAVTIRASSAQAPTPVQPVAVAPPLPPPAAKPAAAPKVSLDSLLGSGALAALMARNSVTPQPPTPQPPAAAAALRSPPPPRQAEVPKPAAAPASSGNPMDLLNALRARGLIGGSAPPPSNNSTPVPAAISLPPPPPPGLPTLPIPLPGQLPTQPPSLEFITGDISLTASSLKQFRPHLLPLLFEAKGPQCTQCGRRFPATEEGRRKKTAHMDWHFRVNRRITEYEKKGQHRSWLVDKMDWINTRETIDQDHVTDSGKPYDPLSGDGSGLDGHSHSASTQAGGGGSRGGRKDWIPVPDDPVLANSVCPICQEKFEMRWLDDAQEFVWPDATHVGDRIYHASCHREATKDDVTMLPMHGGARATPEPVLGKRKAESELTSLRGKIKMEAP
ncbi:hypothetical protein Micbo1qcDRAFT_199683 [Microdochium bolleyi]|uniref:CID domain-containing protein n=1 Tax=Microdochium bolleyi TaxID=196109 RepID=A0A136JIF3_9PEZI|nr:hypothetical protein Micbo1qcDRAFT_199683 [Microdochium bolleyi]